MSFPQLPGEPADAYKQLLVHRDLGPGRLFRQTAELLGCSESTLRRRSEQWQWKERLASYDAVLLDQLSIEGRDEFLERFQSSLQLFREDQLQRAKRVGELADGMLSLVKESLQQQLDEGVMLRGRELPAVLSAVVRAMEGAMNIEASALGVSELMEELRN